MSIEDLSKKILTPKFTQDVQEIEEFSLDLREELQRLGDLAWYGFDRDKLQVRMEHRDLVEYAATFGVPVDKTMTTCAFNGFRFVRSLGQSMMETAYLQGWKDLAAAFIWLPADIAGPLYEPQEN